MSGIVNQVGARSGIISGGSSASTGTVTLSGVAGLDYEEGTFTPASTTVAFSSSAGTYTKIGNCVHVLLYGTWGGSGLPGTITGLPFALGTRSAMGVVALNNVNTNYTSPFAYTPGTTTYSYIWSVRDDTTWGDAMSSVASGDQIQINMTYQTA